MEVQREKAFSYNFVFGFGPTVLQLEFFGKHLILKICGCLLKTTINSLLKL